MLIVKNANEEHQFLFAVNVLSAVKSDALFSYIAPSNIIGWLFTPLRFVLPFRVYVMVNRTIIKATHFPILFIIFAYERLRLTHYAFDSVDYAEKQTKAQPTVPVAANDAQRVFNTGVRVREPSIATYRKDRALEEVFRHPFNNESGSVKPPHSTERGANVVHSWMTGIGGLASPPLEQPRSVLERLETDSRLQAPRSIVSGAFRQSFRHRSTDARSAKSDPIESNRPHYHSAPGSGNPVETNQQGLRQSTDDADADDELVMDSERAESLGDGASSDKENATTQADVSTPRAQLSSFPNISPFSQSRILESTPGNRASASAAVRNVRGHARNSSTNTIVFKPLDRVSSKGSSRTHSQSPKILPKAGVEASASVVTPGQQRKRLSHQNAHARTRPSMPLRDANLSAPITAGYFELASRNVPRRTRRAPSFDTMALDLASDIGDQRERPLQPAFTPNARPFRAFEREPDREADRKRSSEDESALMSRLVLARMNVLEEGFKDILKEVREWKTVASSLPVSRLGSAAEDGGLRASKRRSVHVKKRDRPEGSVEAVESIVQGAGAMEAVSDSGGKESQSNDAGAH